MGSTLKGLFRKLTWGDFSGPQPSSNPDNMWAQAAPGMSPSGITTLTEGTGVSQVWKLGDTVTVSITFDSPNSWVLPSVKSMDEAEKNRLLNHEQGHYNLIALLARDFFWELMQLKAVRFATSADVGTKVREIHSRYTAVGQPLQDLYDSKNETDHGRSSSGQTKWDNFIQKAFTEPRVPAISAPDGTAYKVEILSVIRGAGLTI